MKTAYSYFEKRHGIHETKQKKKNYFREQN